MGGNTPKAQHSDFPRRGPHSIAPFCSRDTVQRFSGFSGSVILSPSAWVFLRFLSSSQTHPDIKELPHSLLHDHPPAESDLVRLPPPKNNGSYGMEALARYPGLSLCSFKFLNLEENRMHCFEKAKEVCLFFLKSPLISADSDYQHRPIPTVYVASSRVDG